MNISEQQEIISVPTVVDANHSEHGPKCYETALKLTMEHVKHIQELSQLAKEQDKTIIGETDSFPGVHMTRPWNHDSSSDDYCGVDYENDPRYSLEVKPNGQFRFTFEDRLCADGDYVSWTKESTSWATLPPAQH